MTNNQFDCNEAEERPETRPILQCKFYFHEQDNETME